MNFYILIFLNLYEDIFRKSSINYGVIICTLLFAVILLASVITKYLERKNVVFRSEQDFNQYLLEGIKSLTTYKMRDGDTVYIMLDVDDINIFLEKGKR